MFVQIIQANQRKSLQCPKIFKNTENRVQSSMVFKGAISEFAKSPSLI